MKKQRGRNRMKRMGAVLLSVFCVLAAVLVLQTSGQPESGEHVAQAATSPASEEAATQAGRIVAVPGQRRRPGTQGSRRRGR